MKKDIIRMFNLQGLLVDKIETNQALKKVFLHCRSPRKYCQCPDCGKSTKSIHQTGTRIIKHGKISEQQVVLVLKYRRFKCRQKKCHQIFTESFPGIDRKRTTNNLRWEIFRWLSRNSFNFIGSQYDLSPSTITRYLLSLRNNLQKIDWLEAKVTKLGIDEHSFKGRYLVITITDLSHRRLLAILKDDRKASLEEFLKNIPELAKNQIIEACIDLKFSYRDTIGKYLPNAKIVADRFHVEELAKRTLEEIRQIIQDQRTGRKIHLKQLLLEKRENLSDKDKEKLQQAFKLYENFPGLKEAYIIKETVRDFYRIKDPEKAKEKYKHLLMLLETAHQSRYLTALRKTFKRWRTEILNYFYHRTTNGFTEGCHTKIKMMKRVSFGFRNINNYIAKMMLAFVPLSLVMHQIIYHTN